MITKLQLGVSRLENLNSEVLPAFLDRSWIHLGEARRGKINPVIKVKQKIDDYGFVYLLNLLFHRIMSRRLPQIETKDNQRIYQKTNFCVYFFKSGECLPFADNSFDFIFSEHFFEHLFLDEAHKLMKECWRVLRPNGVLRTCVPDADLRTYESPERVGFPNRNLPYSHPDKHKTRWSVYSLSQILECSGFNNFPLRYCDKFGSYMIHNPSDRPEDYSECRNLHTIFDLSYIQRLDNSLIIDSIKQSLKPCRN